MHPHDVMGMFYLNAWGGRGCVCSYLTHSYSSWEDITVWENICGLDDLTLTHPPHVRLVSLGPAALQRNRLSLSWHRASCSGSSREQPWSSLHRCLRTSLQHMLSLFASVFLQQTIWYCLSLLLWRRLIWPGCPTEAQVWRPHHGNWPGSHSSSFVTFFMGW